MSDLYTQAEAESWADGIATALAVQYRDAGAALNTSRAELLAYANPEPHVADVLAGDSPERAIALWDAAIAILRERGVIGTDEDDYREQGPAPWREPGFRP